MENNLPYRCIAKENYQIILFHNTSSTSIEDNVDVEVIMNSGPRYNATFFTLENIRKLMHGYSISGECNNGMYFWTSNMIIVEELAEETPCRIGRGELLSGGDATRESLHELLKRLGKESR